MIEAEFFYHKLVESGVGFFSGVPDSLLKDFCAYITDKTDEHNHIIAVNEGAAVALACGYHLATGRVPLVYMQNSGIGNAVNPLLSLADGEVYRIPLVLVIGWRGEPGVNEPQPSPKGEGSPLDEPQHIKQGKVTCSLLEAMDIPYTVLENTPESAGRQIENCFNIINKNQSPYALVIRKDTFAPYSFTKEENTAAMTREEAIEVIASGRDGVIVSTTGMISRELYELREKESPANHERDFLTVGSMGHASSIALSIALQKPHLPVTCLDGDGAALMHMGALAAIGTKKPRNFCHIVLNNGAHDSVGGQPTIAPLIDLPAIARACGYVRVYQARTKEELKVILADKNEGLTFIEVIVKKGARKDLGRPKSSPIENKTVFMNGIQKGSI